MSEILTDTFPGLGLALTRPKPSLFANRSGSARARGEISMLDLRMTVATNWKPGDPGSVYSTGVMPTVAEDGWAILILWAENVPSGLTGRAYIYNPDGLALYESGTDPSSAGASLSYNDLVPRLKGTAANASKVFGLSKEGTDNKPAGSLMAVNFSGLYGWGKG